MRDALRSFLLAVAVVMAGPSSAQILEFSDLDGWEHDDHAAALTTFLATCDLLADPDWTPICRFGTKIASDGADPDRDPDPDAARRFFELFFKPVLIGQTPALFTGYYEPELQGSPVRTARHAWPIYRRPPELRDGQVFHDRATIEAGALRGRGLELAWLDDPVEAFFLQIQGSGRIVMPDGSVVRVSYAGRNGHAYRSVGQEMVRRGTHSADQVSAQAIRAWVAQYPQAGMDLLNANPSYVFFRKRPELGPENGPIGAMGRSITALRSLAVDPDHTPLGAPVWVEKAGAGAFRRLMVAQDTGGAIKGAQRADIFYGTGQDAGDAAGVVKDGGRMLVLLPIDRAYALLPEG